MDGLLEMLGVQKGRRRDHDGVDIAGKELLVVLVDGRIVQADDLLGALDLFVIQVAERGDAPRGVPNEQA